MKHDDKTIEHHEKIIKYHEETIEHHEKIIKYHEEMIEYHEEIIKHHEEMIEYHEEIIKHHEEIIEHHEEMIKYHEEMIDYLVGIIDYRKNIKIVYLSEFKCEETKINAKRKEILERCLDMSKMTTGLYMLTVPTGGGKTYSSLAFAFNHAKINKLKKLFM